MEASWQSGFCICLINGRVNQKINGFLTLQDAKQFLKSECLDLFKTDYEDDLVLFLDFCDRDDSPCLFEESSFGFIQIRHSVWDVEQAKCHSYNG